MKIVGSSLRGEKFKKDSKWFQLPVFICLWITGPAEIIGQFWEYEAITSMNPGSLKGRLWHF